MVVPYPTRCEASNIFRLCVGNTKKLLPKMSSSVEARGGFWNAFKMPAAHQNDAVNLYMAVPSMIYDERMERERGKSERP